MNQKSRQNSKNNIKKDFYKLMNNSNLGYGCRNNLDNCQFVPIFDKIKEITYLKRYYIYFDPSVSKFVTADLIGGEIEEKFNDILLLLDNEHNYYPIKLNLLKAEQLSSLEVAENIEKKKRKSKRKLKIVDFTQRKYEAYRNQKVKSLIDFDEEYSSSVKYLALEKDVKINLTTRFLNGKMLMFSKVSIKSFVYNLIDVYMFPNEETTKIYSECKIQNILYTKT